MLNLLIDTTMIMLRKSVNQRLIIVLSLKELFLSALLNI
jgi:hypothetical protein